MGVRGKVEAVIYAAEEPVTLQQMVALFGEEALAERQAKSPAEQLPLLPEVPEVPERRTEGSSQPLAANAQAANAQAANGANALPDTATSTEADEPPGRESPQGDDPQTRDPQPDDPQPGTGRLARSREREAREAIRAVIRELTELYDSLDRGMEIREIAGGYRIATKPEYHDAVRSFVKSLKPPMKLSLQALETLAVIAYKQPVTAPEVSEIRGVDSGGVLGSLISRKLVTTAGRKQVVGRPILYKTTKEFLLRFGLKDIAELPSMEEFEKMAGELTSLAEESLPAVGKGAPATIVEAAPLPRSEPDSPRERPVLAPSPISISVEEPELDGIAVNRSGIAEVQRASAQKPEQQPEQQLREVPGSAPIARQETT